jgi:hypothetical protein
MDKFYTILISILNRSFNGYRESIGEPKNGWHITGSTLAYFICNYTLKGLKEIHIAANGSMSTFVDSMRRRDATMVSGTEFIMSTGHRIIIHPLEECPDTISEFPKDYDRCRLQFPLRLGAVLDEYDPTWSEITPRQSFEYPAQCFFNDQRRKNAADFIGKMHECGEKAGIRDKMFIGFGGCLGYAIIQGFLPNDDDIDMCIIADDIPQEQRHQYLMECKSAGLCENRIHGPVLIEDKYCWFSIGPKSPYTEQGVKTCNWFWFKHGGHWWHSKGKEWIGRRDLSKSNITAKGIPETHFKGNLKKVMFHGIEVQIPDNLGLCLDWWYPGWVSRKKEASAINVLLNIPDEKDKRTWFITKK